MKISSFNIKLHAQSCMSKVSLLCDDVEITLHNVSPDSHQCSWMETTQPLVLRLQRNLSFSLFASYIIIGPNLWEHFEHPNACLISSGTFVAPFQVVLGRRLLGVFMTVYMPTILMNIVGHSTMYFKPFFFEAQVFHKKITFDLTDNFLFSGLSESNCNACAHNDVCKVNLSDEILC